MNGGPSVLYDVVALRWALRTIHASLSLVTPETYGGTGRKCGYCDVTPAQEMTIMRPRHVRPRSPTGQATAFLALLQGSFAQAQAYTPDPIPPITAIAEELATDVHWLRQACDTLDAADFAQRSHLAYRVVYLTAIADSVGATTGALTKLPMGHMSAQSCDSRLGPPLLTHC